MLEKVIDPLFLHYSRGKIEVRFTVLNAVVFRLVSTLGLVLKLNLVFQDRGQDLLDILVLKDPTLHLMGEQPELRHDLQAVLRKEFLTSTLGKAIYDPVKKPGRAIRLNQLNRCSLS